MLRPRNLLLALSVFLFAHSGIAADSDIFDSRFPDSEVVLETAIEYDEMRVYTGPFPSKFEPGEQDLFEGSVDMVLYQAPEGRSVLEVFRAYERALKSMGYAALYECRDMEGCGGSVAYALNKYGRGSGRLRQADLQRYIVFERFQGDAREVGHLLVVGAPNRAPMMYLETARTDAEETDLEILSADEIARAIENQGTAAIYGLEFASASSELLPASQPVLVEMAGFLKSTPDVPVLLVGHTDNEGALEYNLNLSRQRAEAVRAALIAEFGIAGTRLEAHGVGFLAPKAPNTSAEGRARNRRVELMLR
ncbi:MAG: OmpA family protein [Pseudomonadota bacterium]